MRECDSRAIEFHSLDMVTMIVEVESVVQECRLIVLEKESIRAAVSRKEMVGKEIIRWVTVSCLRCHHTSAL